MRKQPTIRLSLVQMSAESARVNDSSKIRWRSPEAGSDGVGDPAVLEGTSGNGSGSLVGSARPIQ
jgi:hypothetical protein